MDRGLNPYSAELGTVFEYEQRTDTILIRSLAGGEIDFPAPDFREYVDHWLTFEAEARQDLYAGAFRRTREALVAHTSRVESERRDAPALLAAILGLSPGERTTALHPGSRYCTYEVGSMALEGARRVVHDSPRAALELAGLGRSIASVLSSDLYSAERVLDLRAYAEAVVGNTLRVAGDLYGATRAFQAARHHLRTSSCASLEALEVDNLETSLRRDLRDFTGALELSRRVVDSFMALHMVTSAVWALLKRAVIFENMAELEKAADALEEADSLAGECIDPWTVLMLRHNRVFYLARAGHIGEARRRFDDIQPLYDQFPRPLMIARRCWVEGLIQHGSSAVLEATQLLESAREILESGGYHVDAALVSLDLAAALAELGRYAEVRELAAATYALLESQGVHRDALAALAQFQQAAARERLDREVLRQIAQRLSRAAELRPLPA